MKYIDDLLNSLTMYQVVLYGLLVMAGVAIIFNPIALISLGLIVTVCQTSNWLLAKVFRAMPNVESAIISGLILFFIIEPTNYIPAVFAAIIAMGSKYLLAINKKHIFNPAGIAVFVLWVLKYGFAIWWMATPVLLPATLIVGLLIVRKLRRFSLFLPFLITAFVVAALNKVGPVDLVLSWPLIFFGTIMLTEPQTTPPTQKLQIIYGVLMGVLFSWQFSWIFVIGNLFSYLVSPKQRLFLTLKKKIQLSPAIYEFMFTSDKKLNFQPGQYLEWTLPDAGADSRGNRRYFTIASSPTENELHLGVRMSNPGSSFKKALLSADKIMASQLSGEFTLPKDTHKKLVWIAGGIGITPFRSQAKYLTDTKQNRDIILLYLVSDAKDFVYKDKFVNIKTNYLVGRLDAKTIQKKVPDYKDRMFYLSGPHAMVDAYEQILKSLGVSSSNIKSTFSPATNFSLAAFGSFFSSASRFNAELLSPIFSLYTNSKLANDFKYLAPL